MKFNLGDKVRWSSQAQGTALTKEGVIASVIQPGERPDRDTFPDLYKGPGCGYGRNEFSYVVRVGRKHYWPRTSLLEPQDRPKCPHCGGEL